MSLCTAWKDVNKKKGLCEWPHPVLTALATPGPKEKIAKAKEIQQWKHTRGWINNDVGQRTINGVTFYGFGALSQKKKNTQKTNESQYNQLGCDISQFTIL